MPPQVSWRTPLLASWLLLAPALGQGAPDPALAMAAPAAAGTLAAAAKPAKQAKAARKVGPTKTAALRKARARPVAFTPADGLELTPPQTEQEALEWLERDLSLKVGKRRQADDYPEVAVRYGWSGTALVDVLVAGNGTIKTVALGRTSGFRVLDDQAVEMVKRVSKLWVPARLRGRDTSVTVPIGFQIQSL